MKSLLLIIQKLLDDYYIYSYYISGCDNPTENVITKRCSTFLKTSIIEGLGQNRYDGWWRREAE